MHKLYHYLVLPELVSDFEARYLERMNKIGLGFFALHVPVFTLIAYFNGTGPLSAAFLTLAVLTGPLVAHVAFRRPRAVSLVYGFTAMLMGGLLVHFGQGPAQIEMHFYFFALIAMLAVYANPLVILVAAATVALHHLCLWLLIPASVFNYAAPLWVVAVHAAFVVLESIATCFIARSFFDNVIGLEKIVQARTAELAARNGDLHLLLDNVEQGFVSIDREGVMSNEKSTVVERWLGAAETDLKFADYLGRLQPDLGASFQLGWDEVIADVLPLELCLDQLPRGFTLDKRHYRLSYKPIFSATQLTQVLVVISDVSAEVGRERLEIEQREVLIVLDHVRRDKRGVLEFFEEAGEHVAIIASDSCADMLVLRRVIHTLKGNALLFGLQSIGDRCHAMETAIAERAERPSAQAREDLAERWQRLQVNLGKLLGERSQRTLEIDPAAYERVLSAVQRSEPRERIAAMLSDWLLEPTRERLARVADQAQSIAGRLAKGPLRVSVTDHALKLEPERWSAFWSAFVHVVRNAVDHGLEGVEDRRLLGKDEIGTIELSTRIEQNEFVIEIKDDGRGVDWATVAESASQRGLACATEAELTAALFEDGITTARQVSEYSGRGVGMGAVRAACLARGGRVSVVSQRGGGTAVAFHFPRSEMVSQPPVARLAV